jgi:microcystin-dependent protein
LRINDPNAGGPAGSNSALGIVTGVAAASPAVPALPTSAIPLAVVTVTTGQVQVVDANIVSSRIPSYGKDANPPGTPMPFFGPEAMIPADCVLFNGASISKDTYWRAYYFLGDTYGSTSSNFSVPDLRGRTPFGLDNMGGSDAGRLAAANTLGGTGGAETHTLTSAEMPIHLHGHAHTHTITDPTHAHTVDPPNTSVSINDVAHSHGVMGSTTWTASGFSAGSLDQRHLAIGDDDGTQSGGTSGGAYTGISASVDIAAFGSAGASTGITGTNGASTANTDNAGSGGAHNNMPPYILCNWIAKF